MRTLFRIKFIDNFHAKKTHRRSILFQMYTACMYTTNAMTAQQFDELSTLFEYSKLYNARQKTLKQSYDIYIHGKNAYEEQFVISLAWTNQQRTSCSICISNVDFSNGGHITCGHAFHNKCIPTWISHAHNTCPNCRNQFDTKTFLV